MPDGKIDMAEIDRLCFERQRQNIYANNKKQQKARAAERVAEDLRQQQEASERAAEYLRQQQEAAKEGSRAGSRAGSRRKVTPRSSSKESRGRITSGISAETTGSRKKPKGKKKKKKPKVHKHKKHKNNHNILRASYWRIFLLSCLARVVFPMTRRGNLSQNNLKCLSYLLLRKNCLLFCFRSD